MSKRQKYQLEKIDRTNLVVEDSEVDKFDLSDEELKDISDYMQKVLKSKDIYIKKDGDWLQFAHYDETENGVSVGKVDRYFNLGEYRKKKFHQKLEDDYYSGQLTYSEKEPITDSWEHIEEGDTEEENVNIEDTSEDEEEELIVEGDIGEVKNG